MPEFIRRLIVIVVALTACSVQPGAGSGGSSPSATEASSPGEPATVRCTNAKYGFSVSYPSDWYTNAPAEVQDTQVAACTLFAPFADIEVLPEVVNVPIFLKFQGSSLPGEGTPLTLDGRPGVLVEGELDGVASYAYYAEISADTVFVGFAFDNGSAPFDASRAALDAMIATIDLDGD